MKFMDHKYIEIASGFTAVAFVMLACQSLQAGDAVGYRGDGGAASASATVRLVVNVPVRTLLRVSAAGVEGQVNVDSAAGNVLISQPVLPAIDPLLPPAAVTTITTL
ncbi:hypothetical protein J9253_16975 [Thiothrix litoralis]|uniref:Lipoprotein n=1 Tax=Thiothrix litoralis TaxID=2891210 RepID=A0ABX7WRR4_9GAMM|nr:hypothetical protein [Thiothrix litoralis]QTR45677.1 hypothetical protein J9253_16975 [Thiothrix litoralis]